MTNIGLTMIGRRQTLLLMCCSFLLAAISISVQSATGQTTEGEWTTPRNLSQSGGTVEPFMAVDAGGTFHVFWRDEFAEGIFYTRGSGQQWSQPQLVALPFEEVIPWLIIDGSNRLHMFWLDEEDEELGLLQSSVASDTVANPEFWTVPLAMGAVPFALELAVDEQDRIHMVYAQAVDPAGVYHQYSDDSGISWSPANPLYLSPYFRGLNAGDINLSLVISSSGPDRLIYAAWDIRPLKRVFLASSVKGGDSWNLPIEIAGPESAPSGTLPFNIEVDAVGDQVVLVWQSGDRERCEQLYQWSDDRGDTWQTPQRMPTVSTVIRGCLDRNEIFSGSEYTYLLNTVRDQAYLWVWDGNQWSDPQFQQTLSRFVNPENMNPVFLNCLENIVVRENQLSIVACDQSVVDFGAGDIWLTSRDLGSIDDWFPPDTAWSRPHVIASAEERFINLASVRDDLSNFHSFWSQTTGTNLLADEIFYAGYREDRWSLPQQIIQLLDPAAGPFSVALSPMGQLFVVWGDTLGQILLATATADEAQNPSAWSAPQRLLSLPPEVAAPSLAIAESGELFLAFSIPLNENRGVYLVRSKDLGTSWSDPVLVFDGEAAGWGVVGPVRMTLAHDGRLHLLLKRQNLLPSYGVLTESIHYTSLDDSGQRFAEPTLVAEGNVIWTQLVSAGSSNIHQFWQTVNDAGSILEHAFTGNSGQTWSRSTVISEDSGPVAAIGENDGRVYVVQLTETGIKARLWTGDTWVVEDGFDSLLIDEADAESGYISLVNSPEGHQVVTLAGLVGQTEDGLSVFELQASERKVDPVDSTITTTLGTMPSVTEAAPAPTAVEAVTTTLEEDSTAETEHVIDFSSVPRNSNSLVEILLSLVPVGLIVLLLLAVGLFRAFRMKSR